MISLLILSAIHAVTVIPCRICLHWSRKSKLFCPEQAPLAGESIFGVPNPSFFVRSSRPWRGNPFLESQIQAFCPEQSPLAGESIFGVPIYQFTRNQGYPCHGPVSQLDRNGRTLKKNSPPIRRKSVGKKLWLGRMGL